MIDSLPVTHPHMAFLRKAAKELFSTVRATSEFGGYSPTQPLSTIVAVGARYDEKEGLNPRDRIWLSNTLKFLGSMEILPAQDLKVVPVNMVNKQDFLDPAFKVKADILLTCFIINPALYPEQERLVHRAAWGSAYDVSPFHSDTAWGEAAHRSGARMIVTINRRLEVSSADFTTVPGYLPGPEGIITIDYEDEETPRKYMLETALREDLANNLAAYQKASKLKRMEKSLV